MPLATYHHRGGWICRTGFPPGGSVAGLDLFCSSLHRNDETCSRRQVDPNSATSEMVWKKETKPTAGDSMSVWVGKVSTRVYHRKCTIPPKHATGPHHDHHVTWHRRSVFSTTCGIRTCTILTNARTIRGILYHQ